LGVAASYGGGMALPGDRDRDGRLTDFDLAQEPVPKGWARIGLRGPAVMARWIGRNAKRTAVAIIGAAFLLGGLAMLVLPGPGVIVSLVGLAILATEFAWAERMLDKATTKTAQVAGTVTDSTAGKALLVVSALGLFVAGVVIVVAFRQFLIVGISLMVAGVAAAATLHPAVQRWLDKVQNASLDRQRSATQSE
jgi:hypothetical protein